MLQPANGIITTNKVLKHNVTVPKEMQKKKKIGSQVSKSFPWLSPYMVALTKLELSRNWIKLGATEAPSWNGQQYPEDATNYLPETYHESYMTDIYQETAT